ncbi:MAG: hypothetical protein ACOCRK_11920 [bacterium]
MEGFKKYLHNRYEELMGKYIDEKDKIEKIKIIARMKEGKRTLNRFNGKSFKSKDVEKEVAEDVREYKKIFKRIT